MGSINLPKLLSLSFLAIFVKSRKTHLKYGCCCMLHSPPIVKVDIEPIMRPLSNFGMRVPLDCRAAQGQGRGQGIRREAV